MKKQTDVFVWCDETKCYLKVIYLFSYKPSIIIGNITLEINAQSNFRVVQVLFITHIYMHIYT